MLTIRKPKVEATITEPLPSEHNIDTVFLEGTHTIVHVSGAITGTVGPVSPNSEENSSKPLCWLGNKYGFLFSRSLVCFLLCLVILSETKVCSQESTTTAFSTMTLPTTTYVNGVSPNPPSSEDALSPKCSPAPEEPLTQAESLESQTSPLTRAPTHQLLSIHHTLFEQEEDKENLRDRLPERPGELIAAGECWRRRKTLYLTHMTTVSVTSYQQRPLL